jgi:proline iminopeptidase
MPTFSVGRDLYPVPEPFSTGMLPVTAGHQLYYEQSGKPDGQPALFLHGGPGSGTSPKQRAFFDPSHYRIIMLDQRGSGKSTPFASLEQNTTWDLVRDIEALRALLGIEKWLVFGGSWGSTLALAYAQSHPERCTHLVLRGIFMIRKEEIDYFYQGPGTSFIFPDAWEHYLAPIPVEERGDMVRAYYARLTSEDPAVRAEACRAWSIWEGSTSKLFQDEALVDQFGGPMAESLARIECHYFMNGGFFDASNHILHPDRIARIKNIPAVIIQGA